MVKWCSGEIKLRTHFMLHHLIISRYTELIFICIESISVIGEFLWLEGLQLTQLQPETG